MNFELITLPRALFILGAFFTVAGMATAIETPWFSFTLASPAYSFASLLLGFTSLGGGIYYARKQMHLHAANEDHLVHAQPIDHGQHTARELLSNYTKLTQTQQRILDYIIEREVVNWRDVHDALFPEKDRADAVYRGLHLVHLGFLTYEHVGKGTDTERYVYRLTPEFREFAPQATERTQLAR